MAKVLLTGSAGYIGPVVRRVLSDAGHQVLGVDTGWFAEPQGMTHVADIREPRSLWRDWADVVVHLAGLSNDPMGELDAALTRDINVDGTIRLISHTPQARQVVISSCAVYGQQSFVATESTQPNPQTVYAKCKADVDAWLIRNGQNWCSLRLGTVYGYSPNHRLDLVVNRMVHDVINRGHADAFGDAARPLTHIDDVARAVLFAVDNPLVGIYNVVGQNIRMKALAGTIVRGREGAHVQSYPAATDTRDYMASADKLAAEGWRAERTVYDSLTWLFAKTRTLPPDGNYVRIDRLRALIDEGTLDPKTLRAVA